MFDVKSKQKDSLPKRQQADLKHNSSQNLPVMQRLVYNQSQQTLYTNQNWTGKHYTDESGVDKSILIGNGPVYSINEGCKKYITDSYEIYEQNISVKLQAVRKDIPYNSLYYGTEKEKYKRRLYSKIRKEVNDKIQDEYYLYKCSTWQDFASNSPEVKPVLPPEDLCDPLNSSDVNKNWDESLKSKVCVLIAIVKQMEASAALAGSDNYTRMQQFRAQLVSAGLSDNADLQTKANRYFTEKNSDSLYKLIEILHTFVHANDKYLAYDLNRMSEKLYNDLGYKRIISCNCSFMDLGKNLPQGITLKKDFTYIFIIDGHAMAVTMLENLEYTEAAITPRMYFEPHNDNQNFNVDWTVKNVRQVLER